MLKAEKLEKKFGNLQVLKGISLEIGEKEVVSIVGSSGAGKSTLLHLLGTLEKPDSGRIFFKGKDISALKGNELAHFRNRHIGFVFQFHHLLPEFTALENVCIPGWIARKSTKEVNARALELLALLGLDQRLHHKPSELSGGEQQRVADEPTGNLDSENAKKLHELFMSLRDSLSQAFLIVTHNEELASMSDRILHMKDGMII
jgi:lipoprotein-releasing system ATP-binding protein